MSCIIRPVLNTTEIKDKNTILFAAEELQRYLSAVTDEEIAVIPADGYNSDQNDTLFLGLGISGSVPDVDDKKLDDAILIDISGRSGLITGTNARSVLIGAYRYLRELGFSFIRPGKDGERYPSDFFFKDVNVCEKASYRHRTVCIEGSVYQQNFINTIDWLAKVGMNGYFVQFPVPKAFFDRWYSEDTPYRQKKELSVEDVCAIVEMGEAEIQKRSLMYHTVGHGWTARAIGKDGNSWETSDDVEPQYREITALVNGERKLWGGIAQNTNLCYSNPLAQSRITDSIVSYCKTHPDVTYLHFWLADGTNNNCECDNCRKMRTSDYYIQMLNEIDRRLSEENISTKIVFLIYVDLLWKPLYEKLSNNSRFVLMFAPITRSYSAPFNPDSDASAEPYVLNRLKFPSDADQNLVYLKDWKEDFDCDSFDFDYHFMWDHYYDLARFNLDRVLYEDIRNLSFLGLNGLVSCQAQRSFMPTCVGMNVMADTLWNKDADFDEIADRVLEIEFGTDFNKVKEYLSALSSNDCAEALRNEEKITSVHCIEKLQKALELIADFEPIIQCHISYTDDKEHICAWRKLDFHFKLCTLIFKFYLYAATNKKVGDYAHIKDFVLKNEVLFKDEFDAWCFFETFSVHIVERLRKNIEN